MSVLLLWSSSSWSWVLSVSLISVDCVHSSVCSLSEWTCVPGPSNPAFHWSLVAGAEKHWIRDNERQLKLFSLVHLICSEVRCWEQGQPGTNRVIISFAKIAILTTHNPLLKFELWDLSSLRSSINLACAFCNLNGPFRIYLASEESCCSKERIPEKFGFIICDILIVDKD